MQYSFTGGKPDLCSCSMTSMEGYRRYLEELEELKREIGTLELSPPSVGGDTFITPMHIGLRTDTPGGTGYRSYEAAMPEAEGVC